MLGSARSESSNWINLLARSGLGNWIHQPLSLYKLCASCVSKPVSSCHPKTNKTLDTSLRLLIYRTTTTNGGHSPLGSIDRLTCASSNQELPSNLTCKYWPGPMLLNLTIQVGTGVPIRVGVAVTIYFFYPTDVSKNSFKTQGTYVYPYVRCTKNLLIVSLLWLRRDGHLTGTELHVSGSIEWLYCLESSLINRCCLRLRLIFLTDDYW